MIEVRKLEEDPQHRNTKEHKSDAKRPNEARDLRVLVDLSKHHAFQHEQRAMHGTPGKVAERRAMPEAPEPHHDHYVEIGSDASKAVAAEWDIEVGAQPD